MICYVLEYTHALRYTCMHVCNNYFPCSISNGYQLLTLSTLSSIPSRLTLTNIGFYALAILTRWKTESCRTPRQCTVCGMTCTLDCDNLPVWHVSPVHPVGHSQTPDLTHVPPLSQVGEQTMVWGNDQHCYDIIVYGIVNIFLNV